MIQKNYIRGNIILSKGDSCVGIFKIQRGKILQYENKKIKHIFHNNDILFLDLLFNDQLVQYDYVVQDLVVGIWLSKEEVLKDSETYFAMLSKMIQQQKNQIELLQLKDPLTKISRYLYFEYLNTKKTSFYLNLSSTELSSYLMLDLIKQREAIRFLVHQGIIAKHNKLYQLLDLRTLETYAFRND